MQTQPPPDALAPPPTKAAVLSRRKWKWLCIVGGFCLVSFLAVAGLFFLTPRRCCHSPQIEAVHSARQIGMCLFEFETEYGSFPNATTASSVGNAAETLLPMGGSTSNDCFRQLIGAGIAQDERIFYAGIKGSRKPDGVIAGSPTLAKGEVGFTYLAGLCSEGNPRRPLVIAPVIPGTDRFDREAFDGKAVLLLMDNSAVSLPIGKDGHVLVNGRNILDPGHAVWDGKPPVIVYPDL